MNSTSLELAYVTSNVRTETKLNNGGHQHE